MEHMMDDITRILHEGAALKQQVAATQAVAMRAMIPMVCESLQRGGKRFWLCGNGGSAADTQHLATG